MWVKKWSKLTVSRSRTVANDGNFSLLFENQSFRPIRQFSTHFVYRKHFFLHRMIEIHIMREKPADLSFTIFFRSHWPISYGNTCLSIVRCSEQNSPVVCHRSRFGNRRPSLVYRTQMQRTRSFFHIAVGRGSPYVSSQGKANIFSLLTLF